MNKRVRIDPKKARRIKETTELGIPYFQYGCRVEVNFCTLYTPSSSDDTRSWSELDAEWERIHGIPRFLVHQGVDTFRLIKPIGSGSGSGSAYLAELWATYSSNRFRDRLVVMKCVNREKHPDKERMLRAEVARSRTLRRRDRCFGSIALSIIECEHNFYFYHEDHAYYCCVFPYQYHYQEYSSLRHLLPRHGFPEQDGRILFVLYKTLQALDVLHSLGHVHAHICAARLFISTSRLLKLGFAASMLDLDLDDKDSNSPYMPAASQCRWAAAPELYTNNTANYTKEGDIWLVGIMALELAYGGLRVTARKDLESLLIKINVEKRLPKKLNETDHHHHGRRDYFPAFCCPLNRVFPAGFGLGLNHHDDGYNKRRLFSKEFVNFVVTCLNFQQEMRPTAAQLLCHHVFQRVQACHILPTPRH